MERIGVRELRQHASRHLARVSRGETFEITDRGRPVALLVPVTGDQWHALLESGRVSPPTDDSDVVDEAPSDYRIDPSGQLAAMRENEG